MTNRAVPIIFSLMLLACGNKNTSYAQTTSSLDAPPNILILIADDMGVDTLGLYDLSDDTANTPHLDKLAENGIVFKNSWATPACSTTRAALLTGQYGNRNGVTSVPGTLPENTHIIHRALSKSGYATAVFGKWHLAGRDGSSTHPNSFGIEHYEGNLQGNIKDYYRWTKTVNGHESQENTYHTTAISTATAHWIQAQDKPWLAWVAYSAPHAPIHKPPSNLHSRQLGNDINADARNHYLAAIEAMDTEIGQLLAAIPVEQQDNTVVFFLGDNGTPRRLIDRSIYQGSQGKSSLYEGGIRVPFIVSGAGTPSGQSSSALVNIVDLFPTLTELTDTPTVITDGQSFADLLNGGSQSPRHYNYAEYENGWTVRDTDFKFIRQTDGSEELYDMRTTPTEQNNIITNNDTATIADRLRQYGLSIRGEATPPTPPIEQSKALPAMTNRSANCADYVGQFTAKGRDISRGREFDAQIHITSNSTTCTLSSNSIPNHDFNDGRRAFPNDTAAVTESFTITRTPIPAPTPTPLSLRVDNAIMLNGIKVDVIAAGCHGVGDGKIGCNDMATPWRYDPMHTANGFMVDSNNAHTQPDGAYHYHGPPPISTGDHQTPSGVIGFAADGFPIYGPWFQDGSSIRRARSSYQVKSGTRPSGPGGTYDGAFRDDYDYLPGSGDLDQCNGMIVSGQYGYYVTETYPYILGCFMGTPHPSFIKSGGGQNRNATNRGQRRDNGDRPRKRKRERERP